MRLRIGQFRIRSLLILVVFMALILALLAQTIRTQRLEAELMSMRAAIRAEVVRAKQLARVQAAAAHQLARESSNQASARAAAPEEQESERPGPAADSR
jgi:hypothetical protein